MNSGLNLYDPLIMGAFRSALLRQGIAVVLMVALLTLAWAALRKQRADGLAPARAGGEPAGRRALRIGFGLLWVVDGLLQAQPAMPAGLPSQVTTPAADGSPAWVGHLVTWAGTMWSYHPIESATSVVWIQLGLGLWLLAASQGRWSRAAGLASAGWGLVVWVFGEAFGGIFAPGLTWMFGAPGAVVFYSAAGALIALPDRAWRAPRLGRATLAAMGAFFAVMAVLQAWPGQGFWQGRSHGQPGALAAMTADMAKTPQPGFLSGLIKAFTSFDEAHGFAVNLFVVVALAVIGIGLLTLAGRPKLLRLVIVLTGVLCLAEWVLVQDLGVLGGLGTDPNSMIPMALVVAGGYLALARIPAPAPAPDTAVAGAAVAGAAVAGWQGWARPAALWRSFATSSVRSLASLAAVGLIVIGTAPAAAAQASGAANPILAQSLTGSDAYMNYPAKGFALTDQNGRQVSLASLRGKVVLLTFLDPVCTSACPLIAQYFRAADQLLGASARHVELVAIAANPIYYQVAYTRAFTRQEGLNQVPNWVFLTGSLTQLRQVWKEYGIAVEVLPGGSMAGHSEIALVIDQTGHVRTEFEDDPGPGTAASQASFATLLADTARQELRSS